MIFFVNPDEGMPIGYFLSKKADGLIEGKYEAISSNTPLKYKQKDGLIITTLHPLNFSKEKHHTFYVYKKQVTVNEMLPF